MSREIDLKNLSDEDRSWLIERGRLAEVAASEGKTAQEIQQQEAANAPDAGGVEFKPVSPADAAAGMPRSSAEAERENVTPRTAEQDDYDDQKKADLVSELESRGLSTSGTKAELIERLEADDNG